MSESQSTEQWLADIRVRDASWTANYAHMHRSDGYGQAASDRRSLLAEIERLRGQLQPACKHLHGSGVLDCNGNGEFTCHACGHVQKFGRGLQVDVGEKHGG